MSGQTWWFQMLDQGWTFISPGGDVFRDKRIGKPEPVSQSDKSAEPRVIPKFDACCYGDGMPVEFCDSCPDRHTYGRGGS